MVMVLTISVVTRVARQATMILEWKKSKTVHTALKPIVQLRQAKKTKPYISVRSMYQVHATL